MRSLYRLRFLHTFYVGSRQSTDQFHEAGIVRITNGGLAIWLHPFGMLEPQVVVNLFPKLGVGVDLMRHNCWLGKRFMRCTRLSVWLALSVSVLRSETNEFHKRLSTSGVDCQIPRNEETRSATKRSPTSDALKAPVESGDRAKRCLSEG